MEQEEKGMTEIEQAIETIKKISDLDVKLHLNIRQYDLLTAIEVLKEKAERENPKSLISEDDGDSVLCPYCYKDLMGFCNENDPDDMIYFCPKCGGSIDTTKCGRKLVSEE